MVQAMEDDASIERVRDEVDKEMQLKIVNLQVSDSTTKAVVLDLACVCVEINKEAQGDGVEARFDRGLDQETLFLPTRLATEQTLRWYGWC